MVGIRLKLVVGLMALMLIPLLGSQSWLAWRFDKSHAALEKAAVERALQRLLVAIDTELQNHEKLVNDWANWTEFADYVRQPNPAFRDSNLQEEAIAAAGFSWLSVHDLQGRRIHSVARDGASPEALLASVYGPALLRVPGPGERSCGLARWEGQWMALCHQGIRLSSGQGPAYGLLLVGEPLRKDFAEHLYRLTGLRFTLMHDPLPTVPETVMGQWLSSSLGQAEPVIQLTRDTIQAWWPIRDMAQQPAGHIQLDWPRQVSLQAHQDLTNVQWQLFGFFVLIAIGLLVMLDRVVIRRLVRFSHELRDIQYEKAWQKQVTVDGRDEIAQLAHDTNNLLDMIQTQLDHLELQAGSDPLTGLANRRSFDSALRRALAVRKRHDRPLCLVVLDVDHFKAYNDHYGHAQGDRALKSLASSLLAQARRPGDLPARVGGEEFAVVLEDTPTEGARHWMQSVQMRLETLGIEHEQSPVSNRLTISAGIAIATPEDTAESLFARADAALYEAKADGRNRIVVAQDRS